MRVKKTIVDTNSFRYLPRRSTKNSEASIILPLHNYVVILDKNNIPSELIFFKVKHAYNIYTYTWLVQPAEEQPPGGSGMTGRMAAGRTGQMSTRLRRSRPAEL